MQNRNRIEPLSSEKIRNMIWYLHLARILFFSRIVYLSCRFKYSRDNTRILGVWTIDQSAACEEGHLPRRRLSFSSGSVELSACCCSTLVFVPVSLVVSF